MFPPLNELNLKPCWWKSYSFSHNRGSVENGTHFGKVTTIGGTHFSLNHHNGRKGILLQLLLPSYSKFGLKMAGPRLRNWNKMLRPARCLWTNQTTFFFGRKWSRGWSEHWSFYIGPIVFFGGFWMFIDLFWYVVSKRTSLGVQNDSLWRWDDLLHNLCRAPFWGVYI